MKFHSTTGKVATPDYPEGRNIKESGVACRFGCSRIVGNVVQGHKILLYTTGVQPSDRRPQPRCTASRPASQKCLRQYGICMCSIANWFWRDLAVEQTEESASEHDV